MDIDSDHVPVRVRKGRNVLTMKITQGGGAWRFAARLLDPQKFVH